MKTMLKWNLAYTFTEEDLLEIESDYDGDHSMWFADHRMDVYLFDFYNDARIEEIDQCQVCSVYRNGDEDWDTYTVGGITSSYCLDCSNLIEHPAEIENACNECKVQS
jgi:hypothetical protein